jgi:hypothetical protein
MAARAAAIALLAIVAAVTAAPLGHRAASNTATDTPVGTPPVGMLPPLARHRRWVSFSDHHHPNKKQPAKCAGNPATYDAGYGSCSTYAVGHKSQNNGFCATDINRVGTFREVAENVCRECGACTTKETTTTATTTTPEYVHHPEGCVGGHNIKLYHGKTVQECKSICDQTAGCVAFEYGVAYGGPGGYKPAQCQPQSSANKAGCGGAYHNLDLYVKQFTPPAVTTKATNTTPTTTSSSTTTTTPNYVHHPEGCVGGHNIKLYHDKTVQECKSICDETAGCVAFEYGVAYGGVVGYKPAQCQPQSSANKAGCDGAHHNLDLYVKQ